MLAGGQQHVIFVDPKGIRNLGPRDPKIQFHETIKEIEQRLGDPRRRASSSFIVSNTPSHDADAVGHGEGGDAERNICSRKRMPKVTSEPYLSR